MLFCSMTPLSSSVSDTMASSTPLTKANTSFSLALFKSLGDNDKTANIFYSPFSISSALAMVMLGSAGNTATQMSEVHTHTHTTQINLTEHESFLCSSCIRVNSVILRCYDNVLHSAEEYNLLHPVVGGGKAVHH